MSTKLTTECFIQRALLVHEGKYKYHNTIYHTIQGKVEILCPTHGSFQQTASHHLQGKGCPKGAAELRARLRTSDTPTFISKSLNVHGTRYDYSEVVYESSTVNVAINCKTHGKFLQTPNTHLGGKGCPKCGNLVLGKQRLTLQEFINTSVSKHGKKYDYSLVDYTLRDNKVTIICPDHGEFRQSASGHMVGKGCRLCQKTGFQDGKVGSFYILTSGDITKVGITNRDVSTRAADISSSSNKVFSIDYFIKFQDGSVASQVEKEVLAYLNFTYDVTEERHDGYTECFKNVDMVGLLSKVTSLCCTKLTSLP